MSAIEDIAAQVNALQARQLDGYEALLGDISLALSGLLEVIETPDTSIADAIIQSIRGLSINAPAVNVNVQPPPPADVQVTVQPAQINVAAPNVTFSAPEQPAIKGWTLTIAERDGNGSIRRITLKPEN